MMHAEVGFQVVRVSLRDDVTMFIFTVRHDGSVPTDTVSEQQALLRARLAGAGWETPAILRGDAAGNDVLLRSGEPDPHAVVDAWPGGPGRRCGGVPVAAGRPGFRAGDGRGATCWPPSWPGPTATTSRRSPATTSGSAPLLRSKQDAAQGLGRGVRAAE